jgi:cytochrome P450
MDELTPLSAVTARDPYPYYARLVAERPFAYDERIGAWVAAGAAAVQRALDSPALRVRPPSEPVPQAMLGTSLGDMFARLARMNDGARHAALTSSTAGVLGTWDLDEVGRTAARCAERLACAVASRRLDLTAYLHEVPASTVAALLSVDAPDATRRVHHFASAIAPGATHDEIVRGAAAADALARALPPAANDDALANALGFLFQAYDATAGLIGHVLAALTSGSELDAILAKAVRYDAPVHNTRRFAAADTEIAGEIVRAGETVLVLLAAANRDPRADRSYTFGFGPHACPGARIAVSIAKAGIAAIVENGIDRSRFAVTGYRRSLNARIPIFAAVAAAR